MANKIVYAENVRQAFQFAESGNAEICLTSFTLVGARGGQPIDAAWYPPIEQTAALLKQSPQALKLFNYLTGPEAKEIYRKHGLAAP